MTSKPPVGPASVRAPGELPGQLPDALRLQLRSLRRDEPPSRDLWTGIAMQLGEQPPRPVLAPVLSGRPAARARFRRWTSAGLAATLLLALGVSQLHDGTEPASGTPAVPGIPAEAGAAPTLVQREADGLSREYLAALAELSHAPSTPGVQPAIDEIDRSASEILAALTHDPSSLLLLEQLRRTYARRLELTQRAIHT